MIPAYPRIHDAATTEVIKEKIKKHIVAACKVRWQQVQGRSQKQALVDARCCYWYLVRQYTNATTTALAAEFNRDHSTICHGTDKVKELLSVRDEIITPVIESFHRKAKRIRI